MIKINRRVVGVRRAIIKIQIIELSPRSLYLLVVFFCRNSKDSHSKMKWVFLISALLTSTQQDINSLLVLEFVLYVSPHFRPILSFSLLCARKVERGGICFVGARSQISRNGQFSYLNQTRHAFARHPSLSHLGTLLSLHATEYM